MPNFFPRSSNWIPLKILVIVLVLSNAVTAGVWYYFTPKYTRQGYQPDQPIPFPHDIHVKQLGMDCRYCHSFVEVAAHSNIPNTQLCLNCHSQVQKDNPKLQPLRDSWQTGQPVQWVQIHKTPEFAYFNHSIHVNRGISCISCHGSVNDMSTVFHEQPQSMSWCLDCHRAPENALRPVNEVFNLDYHRPATGADNPDWRPPADHAQVEEGLKLKEQMKINPPVQSCAGCHR
ncbi:MAG TPA: cytochrome c3 family protein [Chthoniobacteraceae bacterium]|nr:cytochrome c3 family protein [Chthoniobacteraceae bacterium]